MLVLFCRLPTRKSPEQDTGCGVSLPDSNLNQRSLVVFISEDHHENNSCRQRPPIARLIVTVALFLVLICCATAVAQDKTENKVDETFLKNLQFRAIGPAIMGGRIDDIAVVENNPSTYYVGTATGGIWKTVTTVRRSIQFSTSKARLRSATSRLLRRTRASSGWEPASRTTGKARRGVTESTDRWTPARPGQTWACAIRGTSVAS